ncbi:methyltransferase domain-containing protein [Pseudomonas sp. F1_0610]|uniref:putative RNA methyltransferase n=1 Tax=Pseudomonas sp. F1_0610 TaxID=3114284 RepID=UPI0039C3D001
MLICPLCHDPLTAHEHSLTCSNNHCFDQAKQGYYNLLPVQHKNSRSPGDNQEMVLARRAFLQAQHYQPLALRLAQLAADKQPKHWVDVGCGEGYYTDQISQQLPSSQGYALDISRDAVKRASKGNPSVTWMVASMARIPLATDSCQVFTSVFSPLDWQEAQRVLSLGGGLLRMGPCHDHLIELRRKLYDEVRHYDDEKHLQLIPNGMQLEHSEVLRYNILLESAEDRANLLAMTPHGWRATTERRNAVINQPLAVTVAIRYDWIVKHEEANHAPA